MNTRFPAMGEDPPAQVTEESGNTSAISNLLREGPQGIIQWLGNNEIRVGSTTIATREGTLVIERNAGQQQQQSGAGFLASIPTPVKIAVPLILAWMILKR